MFLLAVERLFVYVDGVSTSAPTLAAVASLADVERVVGVWCDITDPAVHTGADAVVAVERLATVIRRLTAKQAGFAERVDACRSFPKQSGSADDWLARQNGTSKGDAKKAIDTARRMKGLPVTADAFAHGDLSVGEAEAISGAAAVDPTAEQDLVDQAKKTHDLADTKDRAAKAKAGARAGEDPAERKKRLRARRRWNEFDEDEMQAIAARFLPEEWARVAPVVDAFARAIFERARKAGITEPSESYRADAVLAALATAGEHLGIALAPDPKSTTTGTAAPAAESAAPAAESTGTTGTADPGAESTEPESELDALLKVRPGRVKWNVSVLIDGIALKRGYATAKETCEIVGVGPVDVDWVSRILPEALVDVLVHDLVDIGAHATMTRHRRKAVDNAIRARDRRCVVPGCRRRRRLQADHRHDFAKRGPTSNANLELLCEKHHAEKTNRGARIARTDTEWHWYPPPPAPGEPEPPPGSIPWRAPIGEHLTAFDLHDLPPEAEPDEVDPMFPFD